MTIRGKLIDLLIGLGIHDPVTVAFCKLERVPFRPNDKTDWRNYLPLGIIEMWDELTDQECLLVMFIAQSRVHTEHSAVSKNTFGDTSMKSRWYEQGARAYWHGDDENPYAIGTTEYNDWEAGWRYEQSMNEVDEDEEDSE